MDPPTGNRGGGIVSHAVAVWIRSVWLPDRVKPVHLDPCLWIRWILWIGHAQPVGACAHVRVGAYAGTRARARGRDVLRERAGASAPGQALSAAGRATTG